MDMRAACHGGVGELGLGMVPGLVGGGEAVACDDDV